VRVPPRPTLWKLKKRNEVREVIQSRAVTRRIVGMIRIIRNDCQHLEPIAQRASLKGPFIGLF
jgi:hypothetical protein